MRYYLSHRQLKELLENGKRLRIAVPHPPEDIADYAEWFREHVELPREARLEQVRAEHLTVDVLHRGDGTLGIGAILHEPPGLETLSIEVEVVLASVVGRRRPRGRGYRPQWPGHVILAGGQRVPRLQEPPPRDPGPAEGRRP